MNASNPGQVLRRLRQERGLSIESLAAEADLTTVALSHIERKSVRPQRENLLRILGVLENVSPLLLADRQAILAAFGYRDNPGLPNAGDIETAVAAWRRTYQDASVPAYLVDIAQRIHDWNDLCLLLLGERRENLDGLTVFDLLFSDFAQRRLPVTNAAEVLDKTVAMMGNEFQAYAGQPWVEECLQSARQAYPLFGQVYDRVSQEVPTPIAIRTIEPVCFAGPQGTQLRFRIVGVDLVSDPRFRAVQYVPLDAPTMRLLAGLIPTP